MIHPKYFTQRREEEEPLKDSALHDPANRAARVETSRGRLLRVLGAGFGLAVIIGNTIGAGILRTPGDVAKQLPHVALFIGVWIAGALYALLGANPPPSPSSSATTQARDKLVED